MRGRQVGITLSLVLAIVGTLFGTGAIGTRVEESSGGDLSADATLIAPAGPAFSIWSVIYLGLIAYTIWQWRTTVAGSQRHRAIAVPVMASLLLNAAWLFVTQAGWIWVSVLVIAALLLACALVVKGLHENPPVGGVPERIITDGTFGLYLGWVCVAICANVTAAAVGSGAPTTGTLPTVLAVVVLAVVVVVAAVVAMSFGARVAVAAAIVWGLGWIAYGRLADAPPSAAVGIAAIVAAIAVVVVTWWARTRRSVVSA